MSVFDYPVMLFKMFLPKKETVLQFPEIGWTITIPKGFEVQSHQKAEKREAKGLGALQVMLDKKINYSGKTMFTAVYEMENVFTCDFTNLTTLPETVWEKQVNDLHSDIVTAMHTVYKPYAHVSITVENDARQKGNITFKTFEIIVSTPQRELNRIRYFSTVYKDYGVHIMMIFTETAIGEQMMNALRNSTFS